MTKKLIKEQPKAKSNLEKIAQLTMLKDEKKSGRKARKSKEREVSDLITADIETREMKE
jgi:hypothetical protein